MFKSLLLASLCLAAFIATAPARAGEPVTYYDGDAELQGYWAPADCETNDNTPVVLVVHQWKGLGDYEKARADQLSAYCYDAFAIDMYGKGIRPATNEEVGAQAGKYKKNPALARKRIQAAVDFARQKSGGENTQIAALGYCFGGTMALELARSGADVAGVVSFHGGLGSEDPVTETGVIDAAVQVHHGAADPHVPPEEVEAFMAEMDTADADWMLTQYADAVHAFTEKEAGNDPSTGVAYNEKADKRSWAATLLFLSEIFKGP